jgi:hypothetical protein
MRAERLIRQERKDPEPVSDVNVDDRTAADKIRSVVVQRFAEEPAAVDLKHHRELLPGVSAGRCLNRQSEAVFACTRLRRRARGEAR